jgi:hypothetical protein
LPRRSWKREEADVFYSGHAYLIQSDFHIGISATGISQDINPLFRTITDSVSCPTWQRFRANSFIAPIKTSVTRYHYSQCVFAKGARQTLEVLALG